MTDPDDGVHRSLHTHRPDEIDVREPEDVEAEEGMMEIRLPIASTGDVRNEGDDPLSASELRGMAQQVDSLTTGVFPEHGNSDIVDFAGYSQFEKLGYWADAEIEREASEDESDLLVATARMPDPETLPAATGSYREALAILKEQAVRGIPITSSIGWREDEDAPGGNDLMEVSIVGVAADPRAGSEGGEQLVARAAVEAGADPEALVDAVREAVQASDADDPEDTHDMSETDDPPEEEGGTTEEEQSADTDEAETTERGDAECPECETSVRDDANYCRECGTDLRETDEDEEDDEEEDEEDEEDEEQSTEPDEEHQAGDELATRLDDLEEELEAVRRGEVEINVDPGDVADELLDDDRDADGESEQADEHDPTPREEWLSDI